MNVSVPVYQKRVGADLEWASVGWGERNHVEYGRSTQKLRSAMTRALRKAAQATPPERLEELELHRGVDLMRVHLQLSLRGGGKRRKFSGEFPLVTIPRRLGSEGGVVLVAHPMRQQEWFPWDGVAPIEEVATRFLQRAWAEVADWEVEDLKTDGKDRLLMISFSFEPKTLLGRLKKKKETPVDDLATLGGGRKRKANGVLAGLGVNETARAADGLLERGLERAALRARLGRAVASKRRRSVLLVGEHGAGKTTLVHGAIMDALENDDYASHRNLDRVRCVWRISGRRLIAGMSYVGQWEQRCVELIEEASRKRATLWVEDLHAWGRVGRSRQSDRCLADMFRGPVTRGDVVVIGEMTEEQRQQLDEDAPGFTDAFARLPVPPTGLGETMRVLLHEARRLELRHSVVFSPMAYRALMEMSGALLSTQAFPGKAVDLLGALARLSDGAEAPIDEDAVMEHMRRRTGVPRVILDQSARLDPAEVREAFASQVMGQPEAVEVAAQLVTRVKAGVCPPRKPWGVFLFAGPTGTGKTELAKSIASYLYGDEERLVRLDMSEYATPDAASRLAGDPWEPEGVLTRRVRAQPFCVVLLDEIEKADRSALNLLLQVFDEGRLKDASGQVADFSHAVIVMTSNLGSGAGASIGFGEERPEDVQGAAVRAARDYFSPELFNRIDRVVAFRPLSKESARRIASKELAKLLARGGLTERGVFAVANAGALDVIADEGFDTRDGARSLKRYLEREITTPLVDDLVASPDAPMRMTRIYRAGGAWRVRSSSLSEATPLEGQPALEPLLTSGARELVAELPRALEYLRELEAGEELQRLSGALRARLAALNIALDEREGDHEGEGLVGAADEIYNLELMRSRLRGFADEIDEFLGFAQVDEAELLQLHEDVKPQTPSSHSPSIQDSMSHKRRLVNPSVLRLGPKHRGRDELLADLAEVHFLRRAIGLAEDPTRHAVELALWRVGAAQVRRRFHASRDTLLEGLARALGGARGEVVGAAARGVDGELRVEQGPGALEAVLAGAAPEHVVVHVVGLCVRDFFEGEDGCHVRHSLGGAPEVVRVRVRALEDTAPGESVLAHERAVAAFESELEAGRGGGLEDPGGLDRLVRRLRYESPEAPGAPVVYEVEDFVASWAARKSARSLEDALRGVWLLRMSAPEQRGEG
jgi:ATP-dependent Clp protease ATP-binding subunit ClpA/ATP-dependent Clp protease ATP-binding subunit ClpC